MKKTQKGFTLIELLVVIAIIGILSAIVLASLSSARAKAKDAKVKGQLTSMRNAAEIYSSGTGNGKYQTGSTAITACTGGAFSDSPSGMTSLIAQSQNDGATLDCGITAAGDAWSVAATLPGGTWWCVDSTGASKGTQGSGTTAYTALTGSTGAHASANATVCN